MKALIHLISLLAVFGYSTAAQEDSLTKSLSTGSLAYSLMMLGGVTLAIIVIIYALKKTQQLTLKKNSGLKVIGGLTIGGKERLVVVEMNNTQILLGVTTHTITCLDKNTPHNDELFHQHLKSNVEKLRA